MILSCSRLTLDRICPLWPSVFEDNWHNGKDNGNGVYFVPSRYKGQNRTKACLTGPWGLNYSDGDDHGGVVVTWCLVLEIFTVRWVNFDWTR